MSAAEQAEASGNLAGEILLAWGRSPEDLRALIEHAVREFDTRSVILALIAALAATTQVVSEMTGMSVDDLRATIAGALPTSTPEGDPR